MKSYVIGELHFKHGKMKARDLVRKLRENFELTQILLKKCYVPS